MATRRKLPLRLPGASSVLTNTQTGAFTQQQRSITSNNIQSVLQPTYATLEPCHLVYYNGNGTFTQPTYNVAAQTLTFSATSIIIDGITVHSATDVDTLFGSESDFSSIMIPWKQLRILFVGVTPEKTGIYRMVETLSPSDNLVLVRTDDFTNNQVLLTGALIPVSFGRSTYNSIWGIYGLNTEFADPLVNQVGHTLSNISVIPISFKTTPAVNLTTNTSKIDGQLYNLNGTWYINTNSSGTYDWQQIDFAGGSPGGAAGGDLSGTYPNPTVNKIEGVDVSATNATAVSNLTGVNSGDQNVFQTISVSGQSDVVADTTSDTLTLAAGTGITLTTDATTDTVTITSTATSGFSRTFGFMGA